MYLSHSKVGATRNVPNSSLDSLGQESSHQKENSKDTLNLTNLLKGDIFKGQVTDVRNGFITIQSGGQFVTARYQDAVNVCIGDILNFVVRENSQNQVTIAPFIKDGLNREDAAIYKALLGAGLPATDKNLDLIGELLRNQMPLDKKSIHTMLSFTFQYPDASMKDLVFMCKNQIPISEENLNQLKNYQSKEHQITNDMIKFAEELPEFLERLLGEKGEEKTISFLQQLVGKMEIGTTQSLENLLKESPFLDKITKELFDKCTVLPNQLNKDSLESTYHQLDHQMNAVKEAAEGMAETGNKEMPAPSILNMTKNIQENFNFMKSVNDNLVYVQIPVMMKNQMTSGDLYVFTNRKNKSNLSEGIQILLHLSMSFLGEVDVLAKLKEKSLHLDFSLSDKNGKNIVEKNLNSFIEILEKKGFCVSAKVEQKEAKSFQENVEAIQKQDKKQKATTRYGFDMRA